MDQLSPVRFPARDRTHIPGMCPDWESNLQPFGVWDNTPTNCVTQPGLIPNVFMDITQQRFLLAQATCPTCICLGALLHIVIKGPSLALPTGTVWSTWTFLKLGQRKKVENISEALKYFHLEVIVPIG